MTANNVENPTQPDVTKVDHVHVDGQTLLNADAPLTTVEEIRAKWRTRRGMAKLSLGAICAIILWAMAIAMYAIIFDKSLEKIDAAATIISTVSVSLAGVVVAYITNATWSDVKKG